MHVFRGVSEKIRIYVPIVTVSTNGAQQICSKLSNSNPNQSVHKLKLFSNYKPSVVT